MLVLSNEDVDRLIDMKDCIAALEPMYRDFAQDRALLSPRVDNMAPTRLEGAYYAFKHMGGTWPARGIQALRLNSDVIMHPVVAGKVRRVKQPLADGRWVGLVLLFSTETGQLLALFPDGVMQRLRVGAANGIGLRHLAREDAHTLGLIGTGWQAQAQVLCQPAVRKLTKVRVYSPTPGNSAAFAKRWEREAGVEIEPVASARDAVKGSDFIITATNAPQAVVMADWLEPGQFITGVKDQELEMSGWERCDVVVVNRHGAFWQRYAIGGLEVIPEHGQDRIGRPSERINWNTVPTLGDVMVGKHPGRTSDDQIIGMILGGDGVQFTAVGARIYQRCKESGLGVDLPRELFLQDEKYIP